MGTSHLPTAVSAFVIGPESRASWPADTIRQRRAGKVMACGPVVAKARSIFWVKSWYLKQFGLFWWLFICRASCDNKMEINRLSNELLFEVIKDFSSSKAFSVDFSSAGLRLAVPDWAVLNHAGLQEMGSGDIKHVSLLDLKVKGPHGDHPRVYNS